MRIQAVSPAFTPAGMSGTHRGDGGVVFLAAANSHDLLEVEHEDLAVADVAGPAAFAQRLDRRLDEVVGHGDLEADLLGQPDPYARAAVRLHTVELSSMTLHTAHREPTYFGAVERLQHLVRLLGADDPDHEFHGAQASSGAPRPSLAVWMKRAR